MKRTITETVPVAMSYQEYSIFDAIAQHHGLTVEQVILRLASAKAAQWVSEEGEYAFSKKGRKR